MSLEKEFLYYSNRLKANPTPSDSQEGESVLIGGANYTYLNVKVVLSTDLLDEINVVSQTIGASPEIILANYLQFGEDLRLTPIRPEYELEEDLDYDVTYLLESEVYMEDYR